MVFENNYALNPEIEGMPDKDLTVEFWAKTPAYDNNALGHNPLADLLTYATHIPVAESYCTPLTFLELRSQSQQTSVPFFASWLDHSLVSMPNCSGLAAD